MNRFDILLVLGLGIGLTAYLVNRTFHRRKKQKHKRNIKLPGYTQSDYYRATKTSYAEMRQDKGKYGEYLIYKELEHYYTIGARFLFNLYIPKEDGTTTEIDAIMMCTKGIFVFESKNYKGIISGNETDANWVQKLAFRTGTHEEQFYNPIWQNRTHIKYLKTLINMKLPMWSTIVFSDECAFGKIKIQSDNVGVIHLRDLNNMVSALYNRIPSDLMTRTDVNRLYSLLYPYTQVDSKMKMRHIDNIQKKVS